MRSGSETDLGQAGVGLDTHEVGQRQADQKSLDQALGHNPDGLVVSVEITYHTEKNRRHKGLQSETLQIIIAILDNGCLRGEKACQHIALQHDECEDQAADGETHADTGKHGLFRTFCLSCSHVLGNEGSHGLHQSAGHQHGEVYDLAGNAVTGGGLQSQTVDESTERQERNLGQKLLKCQRQTDLKELFALGIQAEILLCDLKRQFSSFIRSMTAKTTLRAWARTVATAAPAASI